MASKLNVTVMQTIGAPKIALSMLGWEYGDARRPLPPVSEESRVAIEGF